MYNSDIEALLFSLLPSYTPDSLHLSMVVSIEPSTLAMVFSIYLKSQRLSEVAIKFGPRAFSLHMCTNALCRSVCDLNNVSQVDPDILTTFRKHNNIILSRLQ